jgi:two-component system, NarL family, invasion response regulator UvrY
MPNDPIRGCPVVKILVVDDHPIVRSGLRRLLAGEAQFEMQEAAGGKEALAVFREYRPDLVVLDLSMPGLGGLEVIGRLKIEHAGVRILILSMHQGAIYATRALQAGATGFISKNSPPDRLLEAIRRTADGHRYIEHEIAQELALANIGTRALPLQDLSPREFEILRLLGDGGSLRQISDTIGVSYKTVANACTQIKAKLRVGRTADLIHIAIRNGVARR